MILTYFSCPHSSHWSLSLLQMQGFASDPLLVFKQRFQSQWGPADQDKQTIWTAAAFRCGRGDYTNQVWIKIKTINPYQAPENVPQGESLSTNINRNSMSQYVSLVSPIECLLNLLGLFVSMRATARSWPWGTTFPTGRKAWNVQKKIVGRSRSAACVVRRAAWTLWHLVTIELWGGWILWTWEVVPWGSHGLDRCVIDTCWHLNLQF